MSQQQFCGLGLYSKVTHFVILNVSPLASTSGLGDVHLATIAKYFTTNLSPIDLHLPPIKCAKEVLEAVSSTVLELFPSAIQQILRPLIYVKPMVLIYNGRLCSLLTIVIVGRRFSGNYKEKVVAKLY